MWNLANECEVSALDWHEWWIMSSYQGSGLAQWLESLSLKQKAPNSIKFDSKISQGAIIGWYGAVIASWHWSKQNDRILLLVFECHWCYMSLYGLLRWIVYIYQRTVSTGQRSGAVHCVGCGAERIIVQSSMPLWILSGSSLGYQASFNQTQEPSGSLHLVLLRAAPGPSWIQ